MARLQSVNRQTSASAPEFARNSTRFRCRRLSPWATLNRRRRSAVIMAAVLIALAVVLMMGAVVTQALVVQRQEARGIERQQQAFWLAESGVLRGLRRVADDPEYAGETWRVPAESLGTDKGAVVSISVEPVDKPEPGKTLTVEARYPDDPVHRVVYRRRQFVRQTD